MGKHLHFVVNPKSGHGTATRVWQQVQAILQGDDRYRPVSYSVSLAGSPFLWESLPSDSVLVALGGDGTVHTVGQEAVQRGLAFGVVPAGTGNDYAANLSIPLNPAQALEVLRTTEPMPVDVIQMGQQYLLNAGGFGLDAAVVRVSEGSPRLKRLGSLGYAVAMPIALAQYRPYAIRLRSDGKEMAFQDVSLLVASVGIRFGGGMRIAPLAHMDDGQMDITIVHGIPKWKLLKLFPTIYRGTHIRVPGVQTWKAKHVHIHFDSALPDGQLDGEPCSSAPELEFRSLPDKLRVVRPIPPSQ